MGRERPKHRGNRTGQAESKLRPGRGAPLRTSDQVVSLSFPRENVGALADAARQLMPEQTSD